MMFQKQISMPVTSRDHLAVRFRQNWQAKHPMDICSNGGLNLDDSLTSLNWLQNLNIMKFATPTPPPSPGPRTEHLIDADLKVNPNSILNMLPNAPVKVEALPQIGDVASSANLSEAVDYKSNPYIKPPYSYATLICMAMKESKKSKMTLSAIYNWITDNFIYYRMADPSWQNSIRHNLSLNKCFQKVPRRKDEPGKGGFWRINPEYSDMFENGILKKRRGSSPAISPPFKRIKREDESSSSSSCAYESGRVVWNRGHNVLQVVAPDDDDQVIGDFNWTSILNQDIEIGGVRIKTERLLDESDYASPIIAMSPPSSESNSEDLGIEELLSQTDFSQDIADFSASSPLDLTITGTSLHAPQWWSECIENGEPVDILASNNNDDSGLHTPVPASPLCYTDMNHPWADESGVDQSSMVAFDVDNLFDIDNVPSPHML